MDDRRRVLTDDSGRRHVHVDQRIPGGGRHAAHVGGADDGLRVAGQIRHGLGAEGSRPGGRAEASDVVESIAGRDGLRPRPVARGELGG